MSMAPVSIGAANARSTPLGVTRLDHALALAARKGAWIERLAEHSTCGARHAILVQTAGASRPLAHLATRVFEALRREGAIARMDSDTRWQLSEKGRVALRRLKSRRGDPSAPDGRATGCAPTEPAGATVSAVDSPLAWLRRRTDKHGRPWLDGAQFEAGERLGADFAFAELGPRVTMSWSRTSIPGSDRGAPDQGGISGRAMAARERVRRAMEAVGPELGSILIDVCSHQRGLEEIEVERGWAKRSAKVVLDLALNALARHYGYLGDAAKEPRGPARVRHWGSDGFRPRITLPGDDGVPPDVADPERE